MNVAPRGVASDRRLVTTQAPILMAVGLSIVRNALEVTTSRNHPAMIPGIWCVIADWVLNNGAGNGNAGAKSVPFRGWYSRRRRHLHGISTS